MGVGVGCQIQGIICNLGWVIHWPQVTNSIYKPGQTCVTKFLQSSKERALTLFHHIS